MLTEPRLTQEDIDAWDSLMAQAEVWSRTLSFRRRVDGAKRIADKATKQAASACVMWSGGKDSTVMTHLLCVEMGTKIPVASEKDDLDYPGEREYVEQTARAWGLDLHILTPPISPRQWIEENASELSADEDMHSRAAGLSKACFYQVVETFSSRFELVFLGLRKHESSGRLLNRVTHGTVYRKRSGQLIATPLADWEGLDVFAYAASRGIDLLHVYRCIGFLHRDEPWRVRKSWWIPGEDARWGGVAWLRRYYPSLFRQLCMWMPGAGMLA